MAIMSEKAILRLYLSVTILVLTVVADESSNGTAFLRQSLCVFPVFLQTNCSSSSSVCEWTFGERIPLPLEELSSPPSDFRAVRGTTQWTWKVSNTTIFASYMDKNKPRTKTIVYEYQCLETYRQSNETFIISKRDLSIKSEPRMADKFNCIRFLSRSTTVVQYKIGPWVHNIHSVSCLDNTTVLHEYPLISDRYFGLLDCPLELQGGFQILSIYDGSRKRQCSYPNGTYGVFESDCMTKDGLVIDFGNAHNCTDPNIGLGHPRELRLNCHSKPWKSKNTTYVMTSLRPRWSYEYEKTTFQCLFYNSNLTDGEFDLYLSNQPKCEQFSKDGIMLDDTNVFVVNLRRKTSQDQSLYLQDRCTFPAEIQGKWLEDSNHSKTKTIHINEGLIQFQSGDTFECMERYIFKHKHSGCGNPGGDDRWPLSDRISFSYDDYTLVSQFQNGCRPRITRLGLSATVDNHVLVYRLSQSEPIVDNKMPAQQYYNREVLRRLCTMVYLYERDPFPYWGRNIEKIIHRKRLSTQPIEKCSLVFNSRHNLLSTVAVTHSSSCKGTATEIYFGCQETRGVPKSFKVVYDKNCHQKNLQFQCIGKAWRFGHFILLRDTVTQRLNCVWFDKKSHAILRLDSPQCSDVDFGELRRHTARFTERFKIKYFERCPYVPDTTVGVKAVNSNAGICGYHNIWIYTIITTMIGLIINSISLY